MGFPALPHEGLTLEFVLAPLSFSVFSPIATVSLLVALLYSPETVKSALPEHLASCVNSAALLLGLKVLASFNVVRKASDLYSNFILGNFHRFGPWNWNKEVVVVTGGSYGIGELISRRCAEKGSKVVVLARTRPKRDLRREHFIPHYPRSTAERIL